MGTIIACNDKNCECEYKEMGNTCKHKLYCDFQRPRDSRNQPEIIRESIGLKV